MVGETFTVPAYDGNAKYEVTEDRGETVVIEVVMENDWDYAAPLLSDRCEVTKANVEAALNWERRWKGATR